MLVVKSSSAVVCFLKTGNARRTERFKQGRKVVRRQCTRVRSELQGDEKGTQQGNSVQRMAGSRRKETAEIK